ncbi:MAG: hypothetical protein IKI34_02375 [Eubacterium sp.]|nr:hypothetical protein [Eubacterium sp.]
MKNLSDIFSGVENALNNAKRGNFEDVLNKTKNYAEQATKKSAERLEISKKKIELLDSKTKLNKAFESFGKLQYKAYSENNVGEEEIQAKIQEIKLLSSRIEYLEAEISDLREAFVESILHDKKTENDVEVDAE